MHKKTELSRIDEYFSRKALSNSLLGLMWNPRWVKLKSENPELEDNDRSYFRIGSAIDCILTSPERWEDDFLVVNATRPWGFMGKFIDNLPGGLDILMPNSVYQEAYDKSGYKMQISKVIDKFWNTPDAIEYYLATRNIAKNKVILSKDEYDSVLKAKELLLANEFIKPYFIEADDTMEILSQVPIYFEYMEEDCKALLDGILIDHKNKVIHPYDLKTIGKSVYDFSQSYLQYGYYRQCAFYELALLSDSSPVKDLFSQGYTMQDFIFIVVETKISSSHPAIIFKTSMKDRIRGLTGGTVGGKYHKGIDELIADYKFHTQNNYWDLPIDLLKSKGTIDLNIFD